MLVVTGLNGTAERDWPAYCEELILRGEFLLDLDWVSSWDGELQRMNSGKAGAPYRFPHTLIELQAVWAQMLDYRSLEGLTRRLSDMGVLPDFDDFTTIWRRVRQVSTVVRLPRCGVVEVSSDGTGIKVNCRGEYMDERYRLKRRPKRFIKVVITSDPRRRKLLAVSASVDGEGSSEPETAQRHIGEVMRRGRRVSKCYADGAYDTKGFFNFLQRHGIPSAVKVRRNASTRARGSRMRGVEAREYLERGYRRWADEREYGMRWPGTEGIFSAVKRKFGERVRARKREEMCREAERRFWAYDVMVSYAKRQSG